MAHTVFKASLAMGKGAATNRPRSGQLAGLLEHVSFWTEHGVDAPGPLIRLIAERHITVGATVGMVPVPGMAPPPELARRLPGIVANLRRPHQAGALMVAGTDAGIAPVKPHDVVRHAPAMLRQLGFRQTEALRAITSVAVGVCGLAAVRGGSRPGSTPTSWPLTATRSRTRTRCPVTCRSGSAGVSDGTR